MPGMNGGPAPAGSALATAFKAALLGQGELALLVFAVLAITWVACRELLPAGARSRLSAQRLARPAEPTGRAIIRIGFGILWIFDAILQGQPGMPAGLPSHVLAPAADGSPGWVRDLVSWAGTGWSQHPVQDGVAAVWIQLGIGVWLLAAARGRPSRAAGLACAGWGLVVWVFGEAFGGMLGSGQSLLTGAPGAALLYAAGGLLVALPARYWWSPRLGRLWLRVLGVGLAAAALLQAWPGRGYWQGTAAGGRPGPLAAMAASMSATPQPGFLARLVAGFGSLASAHGFAVNLVSVIALAAGAAALLAGPARVVRPAVLMLTVFFLADWVLVQDLGLFGGLGTDPNSMLPLSLLVAGALAAATRVRAADAAEPADLEPDLLSRRGAHQRRLLPRQLRVAAGTASASVVVAVWAAAIMLLGAAPMALAQAPR